MEIRELTTTELNNLLDLYKHLHEEDEAIPCNGTLELTWEKIQSNPDYFCIGAFHHEQLIGSCCLIIVANLTRGCRPYAIIENVVIHRNFRRKGYGKAILQHDLSIAWDKNCYKIMLQTGRLNEEIFRFYERSGFDRNATQAFVCKPPRKNK
ncbi:GNAT family N-acetyltransferase [Gilvimarinus chinensis]|uniref:GNAT family N-acetyltransferase n=1 Tax=Gilvimarinus chinensis TaxID=396005 RepID=UPI0005909EF3|nr:GNAT family N-acetyltransferase [Gilvimarinus chinensis]